MAQSATGQWIIDRMAFDNHKPRGNRWFFFLCNGNFLFRIKFFNDLMKYLFNLAVGSLDHVQIPTSQ